MNILKKETMYNGFLQLNKLTIKLPNDQIIEREIIEKRNGIAIVPVTSDGKIYLTKQPRVGVNNLQSIEIPAGIIESNEDPYQAAKRELLEETGCTCEELIPLGYFSADPGCCTSCTYLFLAKNVVKVQELQLDDDEYLESFTEEFKTALKMIEDQIIVDSHSIIGISRSQKFINM